MLPITYKVEAIKPGRKQRDVRFFKGGEKAGFGYQGVEIGSPICMIRCPACEMENYAPTVATGHCAWCNFLPSHAEEIK